MSDMQMEPAPATEPQNTEPSAGHGGNPWLKMVPKETAERYNETLNQFDSFNTFIEKSVESMGTLRELKEKYDGRTFVPGEGSAPSDWEQFWAALGKPSEYSEYGVEEEALAKIYHDANLTREQAEKLTKAFLGYNEQQETGYLERRKSEYEKSVNAIREKYGEELDVKMQTAKEAINNLGGENVVKLFQQRGIDNDPAMIEFFINLGGLMQEGHIPVGHKLKPKASGFAGSYSSMKGIE